ncbi:MAG: NfeD family protein [Actinomycetota bacterium]|nr:NfeD family protein [Actinomycetota bacterium]
MDERVVWGALAALLAVAELASLDLVAGLLAVGALGGLVAAALGAPLLAQVVVAIVASALMLGGVRPVAKRHLEVRGIPNDPGAALEGVTAVVVEQVCDDGGRVRVHGELWSARPALPGTVLPPGSSVWIGAVEGATVTVHPLPEVP